MKLTVFSVYDSAAKAYLPPFFAPTAELAKRMFTIAANDQAHNFNKYAADYTLFELGTWDDQDAEFDSNKSLGNLGTALTYIDTADADRMAESWAPVGGNPKLKEATS